MKNLIVGIAQTSKATDRTAPDLYSRLKWMQATL